MTAEHFIKIPKRRNGEPKRYWYDSVDGHVFHLRDDGTIRRFGFYCEHEVDPVWR